MKPMPNEDDVRNALREVLDPETGMNVVDLGLVYGVEITPQRVRVTMTMTTPACPMGDLITDNARESVRAILPEGVEVDVPLVWDPPWTPAMMSGSARAHFGWS